ncbi:MAG: hypothetical protein KatS3mg031_2551 [Chitinophagales bacterium]|nr:MAG: hypothetical protein KatS3mg031_2551 [Chitinophagales bacterium]
MYIGIYLFVAVLWYAAASAQATSAQEPLKKTAYEIVPARKAAMITLPDPGPLPVEQKQPTSTPRTRDLDPAGNQTNAIGQDNAPAALPDLKEPSYEKQPPERQ